MQWIKASERLPEYSGYYKWRMLGYSLETDLFFDVTKSDFFKHSYKIDEMEWLEKTNWEWEAKESWRKIEIYKTESKRYKEAYEQQSPSPKEKELREALSELVRLKNIKDSIDSGEIKDKEIFKEYVVKKKEAWARATEALRQ